MFKKPFDVQTQSKLKGSDAKKLKAKVQAKYPGLSDEDLNEVLPDKGLTTWKLSNRTLLYAVGELPTFIDAEGRGDIYPTVFTMWKFPALTGSITIHAPVSPFVCSRGADVMLPGVVSDKLGDFEVGDVRCLLADGNPCPIAIGVMDQNSADLDLDNLKGRGMKVIHYYGDMIWECGGSMKPNRGFKDGEVEPFDPDAAEPAPESAPGEPELEGDEGDEDSDDEEDEEARAARRKKEKKEKKKRREEKEARKAAGEGGGGADGADTGDYGLPEGMDMDSLVEYCFYAGCVLSLKDEELPMPISAFYSSHMMKVRPDGSTLDVKKSGYKKIAKFMAKMAKKEICVVKEKQGELTLESIDRTHKYIAKFKPLDGGGGGGGGGKSKGGKKKGGDVPSTPTIAEVWRPDNALMPIFVAVHGAIDKSKTFSQDSAGQTLIDYVTGEDLVLDGGAIKLDEVLINGLFKGFGHKKKLKEGGAAAEMPTEGSLPDMGQRLQDRLLAYHVIAHPGQEPLFKKGTIPQVRVEASRTHGHNVTKLSGIETFGYEMEAMASFFKKKLMCTTSVAAMPGKNNKYEELLIQGHHIDAVLEQLTTAYGLPKKYIVVKQ